MIFQKVYERWLAKVYAPVVANTEDLEERLSALEVQGLEERIADVKERIQSVDAQLFYHCYPERIQSVEDDA